MFLSVCVLCVLFDVLLQPCDTPERVFQDWTIDVDVINSVSAGCRVGKDQDQVLSVGLVQWFYDISALAL
jgi:hypothetical protein